MYYTPLPRGGAVAWFPTLLLWNHSCLSSPVRGPLTLCLWQSAPLGDGGLRSAETIDAAQIQLRGKPIEILCRADWIIMRWIAPSGKDTI
jgi:hypothetical protein